MKEPFMAYSMGAAYATDMMMVKRPFPLMVIGLAALVVTSAADARGGRRNEQDSIYKGTQNGTLRSPRELESGIVRQMKSGGADYIGQEYDENTRRYRLKFMRGQSVIWVDVDGRTGAIVGRAGG